MKKTWILPIVVLIAIGSGLVYWQSNHKTVKTSSSRLQGESSTTTSSMHKQFEEYKGTQYDKIYVASMIAHHQGAVQMAQIALTNANHPEIKDLANHIISTQNSEISQMKLWQGTWGYTTNDSTTQTVVNQMQAEMTGMMTQLNGKTGDEFDKAFLTQMIMHHQSAVDMSTPASTNASHGDVKALASDIITAQTKEIAGMKSWQSDWGFTTGSSSSSMPGMSM